MPMLEVLNFQWKLTVTGLISDEIPVGICFSGDNLPVGGREALLTNGSVKVPGPMLEINRSKKINEDMNKS